MNLPMRASRKLLKLMQKRLHRAGLDIYRAQPGFHYIPDVYGHSAHKQIDIRQLEPFQSLATQARADGRSLLYYDRLYTLYQALINVSRLPVERRANGVNTAEVGVYRGGGSYFIAAVLRSMGIESATHFAIDTFEGHSPDDLDSQRDPEHTRSAARVFKNTSHEDVSRYLSEFPTVQVLKGRIQDRADRFVDMQFHFVHLDVDIYEPTVFGMSFFGDRLVCGGTIVVDDYGFTTCPGVKDAVDEFLQRDRRFAAVHLLTGQMVLTKHSP